MLQAFHALSGLQVSCSKSEIFCGCVDKTTTSSLATSINLKVGSLPVGYLGVPLISGKLKEKDSKPLLDRITSRINTAWTSRFLCLSGRLQLVSSVLASMTRIGVIFSGYSLRF